MVECKVYLQWWESWVQNIPGRPGGVQLCV